MDERVMKFRVGVMVIATLMIAGILVLLFGDARSLVSGHYTIYIHFSDAPGVSEGTPVRKSGILIGRVTGVKFADEGGVIVTAKIDSGVRLYTNEVPEVTGSLLGGDVVIQFIRRGGPQQPRAPAGGVQKVSVDLSQKPDKPTTPQPVAVQEVQGGDYIEGTVSPNALEAFGSIQGELGEAIKSLTHAGDEVGKLATNLNELLAGDEGQFKRITDKTEHTLETFQRALTNLDDVLGDDQVRGNLKKAISDFPELLTDTRNAMNTIQTTVESVDRNLRNLEGFTGPLGERGSQLVDNVDHAVARFDSLLIELTEFSRKLNKGDGTLGQLMRNPELFQHLNSAAINIEKITKEVQPIICNVKVFTDKIARHPESLGVRGALQKSPGIK